MKGGPFVIAIDGPAAAGKGTLARRIAEALNLPYLDTGLLYRAVGRCVLDQGDDPADAGIATAIARILDMAVLSRHDLRGPAMDHAASVVAAHVEVRAALVAFQRHFAEQAGGVLDGRDIGTAIFPDADVKLFVTASEAARAHRRWLELQARGQNLPLEDVATEMAVRDARDQAREAAPLRPAADAILLDTTDLDAAAAFSAAMRIIAVRVPNPVHSSISLP